MYKLYTKGNYFFMEYDNIRKVNMRMNVKILPNKNSNEYNFFFEGDIDSKDVLWGNCVDFNGDAFSSKEAFETFIYSGTGFNTTTSGSSGGAGVVKYSSLASFPSLGDESSLYLDLSTSYIYDWSNSQYNIIGTQSTLNWAQNNW